MSKRKVTKHVRQNIEGGGLSNAVVLAIIEQKWQTAWRFIQHPEEARLFVNVVMRDDGRSE